MRNLLHLTSTLFVSGLLAVSCQSDSRTASADNSTRDTPNPIKQETPAPKPQPITIPSDTPLQIALIDRVSSDGSAPGDEFKGTLAEDVQVDGKTVLDKGTILHGRVVNASKSGRVKGQASLSLKLTGIVRGNQTIPIETKPFVAVAKSTKKKDTVVIAGATGVGAAVGAIAGGGKGAAIGAAVGGGAGTGEVLATKGKDIQYSPEARLNFKLAAPVVL
jgi:hypothetical protein